MRLDSCDIRLCGEAFRPSAMGGATFVVALLGLGWLAVIAAFAG